jgi:predicted metal-binding protein
MDILPVADGPAVIACNACRFSKDDRDDGAGRRGGAMLAAELTRLQAADPAYAGVAVHAMPCLFACTEFCTVHLRAEGKVGYILGRFTPDEAAARAILDYAARYADSAAGQVPYRDWPEGVKGHFIARTPPAGALVA